MVNWHPLKHLKTIWHPLEGPGVYIYIYIIHAWELGVYSLCITSLDFFFGGGGREIFYLFFPLPKPRAWSWESVLNAKGSRANHQHEPFFAVFTVRSWNRYVEQQRRFLLVVQQLDFWEVNIDASVSRVLVGLAMVSQVVDFTNYRKKEVKSEHETESVVWHISLPTFIFQGRVVRI